MSPLKEAHKHHIVVEHQALSAADEVPTEAGTWIDADTGEWLATYLPGNCKHLKGQAFSLRGQRITGASRDDFPSELLPWVEAAGDYTPYAGIISENLEPTLVHWDVWTGQGGEPGRMTCLNIYRDGEFTGGHYVLAEYGIGFDMQDGDTLITPTTILHGNLPREGEGYTRLAVVLCLEKASTAP